MILLMLWLMLKSSFILAVWFTGFLNVNLAIINLLPLPILDGGHVVMNLWAGITRRPVSPRLVNALANAFAVLFIALFLALTFRDSVRHIVPPVRRWIAGEAAPADTNLGVLDRGGGAVQGAADRARQGGRREDDAAADDGEDQNVFGGRGAGFITQERSKLGHWTTPSR